MRTRTIYVLGIFGAFVLGSSLYAWKIPNYEIEMTREIPLEAPRADVAKIHANLRDWPLWHHGIRAITGKAEVGQILTLHFESRIKPWKIHRIEAKVLEWVPGEKVKMAFVKDSSGKLEKMVSALTWSVEIRDKTVHTEVRATTESFRARLFALWMPRILLHQMLYPNVIQLARAAPQARAEFSLNPTPPN